MLSQRVRGAESRAKNRSDKWAAEGAVKGKCRVFATRRYASVTGDMLVS